VNNATENGTMTCDAVCESLSDFLEGGLPPPVRQRITTHLDGCAACAHEARQMEALMRLLHERLPRREPSLDIWAELGPKVVAYEEEERLGLGHRFRLRVSRFVGDVAAGAILFTQALAMNTEDKLKKYLVTDPYKLAEEEG
jgi:hypothetical protein